MKVVKPVNCPLVNERMEQLADLFERFVKTSELKPFNVYNHQGHLKQITVRTSKRGCMLIVDISRDAELDEQRLNGEITRLVSLIRDEANYVTSAYVQVNERQLNSQSKRGNQLVHVYGDLHLIEEMRNDELQYRISPFAFFQVSVLGGLNETLTGFAFLSILLALWKKFSRSIWFGNKFCKLFEVILTLFHFSPAGESKSDRDPVRNHRRTGQPQFEHHPAGHLLWRWHDRYLPGQTEGEW